MSNLMIVESPTKAKKIQKLLGEGWTVLASYGHVRDLPDEEIGISRTDYEPTYVETARPGLLPKLISAARQAQTIYLATDPDREGESIAWHLQQILNLPEIRTQRIRFKEINKLAITKAIANPDRIHTQRVRAQEARRVLDRLMGYRVSPAVSNALNTTLSAGRVQSVALKLIVERVKAIDNFTSTHHFGVTLTVNGHPAKWDTAHYVSEKTPYVLEQALAEAVAKTTSVRVEAYNEEQRTKKPPHPFNTITLYKAAATELGFTSKQTAGFAQTLFEGGAYDEGLITYHRTDSINISEEGEQKIREQLQKMGLGNHLPDAPHRWKEKASAQEGHEAIRTTVFLDNTEKLGKNERALYELIKRRTLASQLQASCHDVQKVVFSAIDNDVQGKTPQFTHSLSRRVYPGWEQLNLKQPEIPETMPIYETKSTHPVSNANVDQLKTDPPKYYNEASLLGTLDKEGIGRPSTLATIMSTIFSRGYVTAKERKLHPTELGVTVYTLLNDRFEFMDIPYSRNMEIALDDIERGHGNYYRLIQACDEALNDNLSTLENVKIDNPNAIVCPSCDKGTLIRRKGKHGHFWGCTQYKQGCKVIYPDLNSKPFTAEYACLKCDSKPLKLYTGGKFGSYFKCGACATTFKCVRGKPVKRVAPQTTDYQCPDCGSALKKVAQKKKKGKFFYPCSKDNDPKCRFAAFENRDGKVTYLKNDNWYILGA